MRITEKRKSLIKNAFRIIDALLFSVLLLLPILPYIDGFRHIWISVTVYLFILIMVLMFRKWYHTAKQRKLMRKIKEQQQIERILLLDDDFLSDRFGKKRFILIRKEHPDRFDILEAIRKQADAIGMFSEDDTLKKLIIKYSPKTSIFLLRDLLSAFNEKEEKTKTASDTFLDRIDLMKYNRYFILGVLFFAASFILRSKIYYRMIATVCLIIASSFGILGNRKGYKNFLIFLDKMDD